MKERAMSREHLSDLDPCPDDEVLRQFARGEIDDAVLTDIVTCHLEFCSSCRQAVSRSRKPPRDIDVQVREVVKHLLKRQAELEQNQSQGPIPGTLWRAVPETKEQLFGPLLFILSADKEGGEVTVAEVSEDISSAGRGDVILHPRESGIPFVCMVRVSNTSSMSSEKLKAFAGRLDDRLTQEISEACCSDSSPNEMSRSIAFTNAGRTGGAKAVCTEGSSIRDSNLVEESRRLISGRERDLSPVSELYPAGRGAGVRAGSTDDSAADHKSAIRGVNGFSSAPASLRSIRHSTKLLLRAAAVLALVVVFFETTRGAAPFLSPLEYFRQCLDNMGLLQLRNPFLESLVFTHIPLPTVVASSFLMMILWLCIAKKTLTGPSWLAFVPGANLFLAIKIARVSYRWLPVLMLPVLWLQILTTLVLHKGVFYVVNLDQILLALLCPWLWPLVMIPAMLTGVPLTGPLWMNGLFLGLFLLGWFSVARGLVARRGKPSYWVLLLVFPITTPIALIYLALAD
jgi:hypothetical protein